jgi:hypothetical protein
VQQIARGHAVDVGQTPGGVGMRLETCQELEQLLVGAVRDSDRQRLFIKSLDVAADKLTQQPVQAALFGLVPAQAVEFLLEVPEGSQPVMLLRKPGMKIVHVSLFKAREEATGVYLRHARRTNAILSSLRRQLTPA